MITCTRRLQFCAGHRVYGHENKCAHLHGHNYVALITAEAPELDGVGRVIDFSVLKAAIGGWIDEFWDHGFILNLEDPMRRMLIDLPVHEGGTNLQKLAYVEGNPTAENMADHLLRVVCPTELAATGVTVNRVELWETENCYAVAEL